MLSQLLVLPSLLTLILPTVAFPGGLYEGSHGPLPHKEPVFTLTNITYNDEIIYSTPAHLAVADGTIEFNFTNTAVPYTTHCKATSLQAFDFFYGSQAYPCDVPAGAVAGTSANFTFSKLDGAINLNQTWTHDDRGWGRKE
jgi:hypothetical protein